MNEQWSQPQPPKPQKILKIPLQFHFEPVQILTKELTKLNSAYPYRIHYMGPRWDNSLILHKKYGNKGGYQFSDKEISKNNNFFNDAMSHNQFYKNQIYYRAFEGVNPTIDRQSQLWFESRFQSGNLDCVVKVGPDQYDLFLRIDSNTRGHLFWFYFEISNCKPANTIKLNICNMSKSIGLYLQGFKPYCSVRNSNMEYINWSQDACFDVNVSNKKLRYDFIYDKIRVRKLMELSFKYKFQTNNPVRFAYCIPYTYSEMLTQIKYLKSKQPSKIKIGSLGKSLTGVDIPYLTVGQPKNLEGQKQQNPVLVCIGRLHPGETNGSHVISGLMNYICTSNEAAYIRQKMVTLFVPMINPDGVILGNSRTNAIGRDLNREFKTKNQTILPEICLLKNLCSKIISTNGIQMFLDFHGHSRKKNMFCFGPNYNITQPQYYRSRVFPRFLSQLTPIFRYFGCDYSIPPNKSTTARAVMLQQQKIPYVYAIQTSIGQYFDYETHKLAPFQLKKWLQLGCDVGRAIKQYFQTVHQFRDYVKYRFENTSQLQSYRKTMSPSKNEKQRSLKVSTLRQSNSPQKSSSKDIKLIKALEQIKIVQDERKNMKKFSQDFDSNSSDSQNEQDNLEKMKRSQFEIMITQCIQTEQKKQQQFEERTYQQNNSLVFKNVAAKRKSKKGQISPLKQESDLMRNLMKSSNIHTSVDSPHANNSSAKSRTRKPNIGTQSKERHIKINCEHNRTSRTIHEELVTKNVCMMDAMNQNPSDKPIVIKHQNVNNWNMRMFNYSQVIEQIEGRNIYSTERRGISRYFNLKQYKIEQNGRPYHTFSCNSPTQATGKSTKLISQEQSKRREETDETEIENGRNTSNKKLKGVFPASFYRIKFQSYQKKKKKLTQSKKIQAQSDEEQSLAAKISKRPSRFLNIKKVDRPSLQ